MVGKGSTVEIDWSKVKDPSSILKLTCVTCGKEFFRKRWVQNYLIKHSRKSRRGDFCSKTCGQTGRIYSEETKQKISSSQKYISYQNRGRKGHPISEETKEKIRQTKTGVSVKADWSIVEVEMKRRSISKYAIMQAPIPDAVFVDKDGKLTALELEKKPWETSIRTKMNEYQEYHTKWDKVIIVWYTLDGTRMKEWVLENGSWTLTS